MLRQGLTFLAMLGLAAVHAPGARADLCFRYGSGGGTLVAKGAAVPAPNTCRTLAMFESGGSAGPATGSICREWSGFTVPGGARYLIPLTPAQHRAEGSDGRTSVNRGAAGVVAPDELARVRQRIDGAAVDGGEPHEDAQA